MTRIKSLEKKHAMAAKERRPLQHQLHGKSVSFALALKPANFHMLGHIFIIPVPLPASENEKRDVGNNSLLTGNTNAEAVLKALVDVLDVPHAAAAGGLSSLGLLTPVDCSLRKIHRKPIVLIPSNTHDSNNRNRLTFMLFRGRRERGSYTCGS